MKVGLFDLILEFMDIHIQIIAMSYLYSQILSFSVCFSQKMDTLAAFLKIFMVYILIVVQDKLRQMYHVYVTGFFVNSCTCSFFCKFHSDLFFKCKIFCIFQGRFDMHLMEKKTSISTNVQIFRGGFFVVQFYLF